MPKRSPHGPPARSGGPRSLPGADAFEGPVDPPRAGRDGGGGRASADRPLLRADGGCRATSAALRRAARAAHGQQRRRQCRLARFQPRAHVRARAARAMRARSATVAAGIAAARDVRRPQQAISRSERRARTPRCANGPSPTKRRSTSARSPPIVDHGIGVADLSGALAEDVERRARRSGRRIA